MGFFGDLEKESHMLHSFSYGTSSVMSHMLLPDSSICLICKPFCTIPP